MIKQLIAKVKMDNESSYVLKVSELKNAGLTNEQIELIIKNKNRVIDYVDTEDLVYPASTVLGERIANIECRYDLIESEIGNYISTLSSDMLLKIKQRLKLWDVISTDIRNAFETEVSERFEDSVSELSMVNQYSNLLEMIDIVLDEN